MLKTSLFAAALLSLSLGAQARTTHIVVHGGQGAYKSIDNGPFHKIGEKKPSNYEKIQYNKHNKYSDADYYNGHLKGLAKANAKKEFCERNPEDHRCDRDDNGISYKDFMKLAAKANAKIPVQDAVKIDGKYFPVCSDLAVDPDGDKWGWENEQSCVVL